LSYKSLFTNIIIVFFYHPCIITDEVNDELPNKQLQGNDTLPSTALVETLPPTPAADSPLSSATTIATQIDNSGKYKGAHWHRSSALVLDCHR